MYFCAIAMYDKSHILKFDVKVLLFNRQDERLTTFDFLYIAIYIFGKNNFIDQFTMWLVRGLFWVSVLRNGTSDHKTSHIKH